MTWVDVFHRFRSSFSNRGYSASARIMILSSSKVSTLETVFKSLPLRSRLRIRVEAKFNRNKMFTNTIGSGCVWTGDRVTAPYPVKCLYLKV